MQVTRTTFAFPTRFYNRLVAISKRRNLSLTQTIQTLVEPVLVTEEEMARQRAYKAFERVKGIVKSPVTDASETIDHLLYGEKASRT